MSDEPRRSVRATKGQHTKSLDILDQPNEPSKKRTSKKGSSKKATSQEAASNDGDGDIIRCVCGATELDDDSDENWICCETCAAWQHNVCVGMPEEVPDSEEYWCEQCKPENHKELLAAEAEGRHLWQERRKAHTEAKKKRKGGKKGKGKRVSDQKSDAGANGAAPSPPAEPAPEVKKEKEKEKKETGRTAAAKRKTRDESQESVGKPKIRKVSENAKGPIDIPEDLPKSIDELEKARQGVATFIHKHMLATVRTAAKTGTFVAHDNRSVEETALFLSLAVEHALHESHTKDTYATQGRAIGFALSRNQKLFEQLNDGELSPQALASMTPDDMATDEMKQKNAEMLAKLERQSTMVQDDGPRIRRTHKGDEIVEEIAEDDSVDSNDFPPAQRRRSMLDPNGSMAARSRENTDEEMDNEPMDGYKSKDDIRKAASKPSVGSPKNAVRKQSTQSANFDIKKIMSSVPSPTQTQIRRPSAAAPSQGPGFDPDVDRMLEDGNESDEYEPAEHDADPSIVWRGTLSMQSIARFPAVARHVGGADLSRADTHSIPWTDLLDKQLTIAGRIDREQGSEYLCGLRYSNPTDVVVLELSPVGEAASHDFDKLYQYFFEKKRYGVLGNRGFANVRDTYLVPVPAGTGNTPEFMLNLQENKLPDTREKPVLLVTVVVRTEAKAEQFQGTPASAISASRQVSVSSATGPTISPVNTQGVFSPQSQTPSQVPSAPPPALAKAPESNLDAIRRKQDEDQRRGLAMANSILGPLITAPTVAFLLPHAYSMLEIEWKTIRDVLNSNPRARDDLPYLSELLAKNAPKDASGATPSTATTVTAANPAIRTGPPASAPLAGGPGGPRP